MAGNYALNSPHSVYQYEFVVGFHPHDDLPFARVRWVSEFCTDFENRMLQTFAGPGKLRFRRLDCTLAVQTDSETRDDILNRSATLVAVLSPKVPNPVAHYGSHWGRFAEIVDPSGSKTRLFKAYKNRCTWQPPQEGPGYPFWNTDPDTGLDMELRFSPKGPNAHWAEVIKLAGDVCATLQYLRNLPDPRPRVYLTGSSPAVEEFHEQIHAFLQSWCQVRIEPPRDSENLAEYERTVLEEMEKCALSIHLVDPSRDRLARGCETESEFQIQWRVADSLVRQRKLAAIAWAPSLVTDAVESGAEGIAIGKFWDDDWPENFDNLVTETMAGLKARIRQRLARPLPAGEKMRIFLIHHQSDANLIRQLAADLERDSRGCQVSTSPVFDPRTFRKEDYHTILDESDAAVICWDRAPDTWFQRMNRMLRAYLGQTCNMSLNRCGVYFSARNPLPSSSFDKLPASGPFRAEDLYPFLDRLRQPEARDQIQ